MNDYYLTNNIKCKTKILEIRSDPNGKLAKYFREKNENSIGDITGFTDRAYLTFLSIIDGLVCTNPDKLAITAMCIICECDRLKIFQNIKSTIECVVQSFYPIIGPNSTNKVYDLLLDRKPTINKILGINCMLDRQTRMNLGHGNIKMYIFNKKGNPKIIPFLMRCNRLQFNTDCVYVVTNFFTNAYIVDYYNFLRFKT